MSGLLAASDKRSAGRVG